MKLKILAYFFGGLIISNEFFNVFLYESYSI